LKLTLTLVQFLIILTVPLKPVPEGRDEHSSQKDVFMW